MKYFITIGDKIVLDNIDNEKIAKAKCCLMLSLSSRLDIFYNKDTAYNRKNYINEVLK